MATEDVRPLPAILHATLDLARRVERAEIDFCARAGGFGTPNGVASLEAGGGRALFQRPGSPLNKVLGLGLRGAVSDEDLDRIEAFYSERQSPAQIELCPLAYADVASRLCARGFVVQGFESEMGRVIGERSAEALPHADLLRHVDALRHAPTDRNSVARPFRAAGNVRVARTTPEQVDVWRRVTAEGFVAAEPHVGGAPQAETLSVDQLMQMMSGFAHPAIRCYLAWIEDEPAAGGAAWMHDGVLGICGTATLARFRRRGLQSAITIKAMQEGTEADLAIASTAPGSTSQRTFERLGFQVLYTRTVFVKT